jgi:hypothetical protein
MIQEYYGEIVLHIAIINRNTTMVEWLLGDECTRPYREKQLTATASGRFFQLYISLCLWDDINMFHFFSVVAHVTMVKLLLHLLAVLINGILSKFYSITAPLWIWSVHNSVF